MSAYTAIALDESQKSKLTSNKEPEFTLNPGQLLYNVVKICNKTGRVSIICTVSDRDTAHYIMTGEILLWGCKLNLDECDKLEVMQTEYWGKIEKPYNKHVPLAIFAKDV